MLAKYVETYLAIFVTRIVGVNANARLVENNIKEEKE